MRSLNASLGKLSSRRFSSSRTPWSIRIPPYRPWSSTWGLPQYNPQSHYHNTPRALHPPDSAHRFPPRPHTVAFCWALLADHRHNCSLSACLLSLHPKVTQHPQNPHWILWGFSSCWLMCAVIQCLSPASWITVVRLVSVPPFEGSSVGFSSIYQPILWNFA